MKNLALTIAATLLFPAWSLAAQGGAITGTVQDSAGRFIVGALVSIVTDGPTPDSLKLTDSRGSFLFDNLVPGEFFIQVTKPGFAPSRKERIQVRLGDNARPQMFILQRLEEVLHRAASPSAKQTHDIIWTLRSSRGTQSILRFTDSVSTPLFANLLPEYSGYFQFYSKADPGARLATLNKGSRFSITLGLPSNTKVTVSGQYNENPLEPKVASAQYEFQPLEGHETRLGVDVRQGIMLDDAFSAEELKEFQVNYNDKFRLGKAFVAEQGAEIGHSEGRTSVNYVRPRAAISWIPNDATVVTAAVSTQAPGLSDDPVRSRENFEQINLPPAFEHYLHGEVGVSRFLDENTRISAAVFEDRANYRALFVTAPDGRHGLLIFDGKSTPSRGIRLFANREFNGFETGIGYTFASGGSIPAGALTLDELRSQMTHRNFHIVTARIKTDFEPTNTELTAVYRWISRYAAGLIDPYQQGVEYNDPTLSISIAQTLPTFGAIPAKIQAILDARNLFEQPYGSSQNQIALSPRFVKGGINIRF